MNTLLRFIYHCYFSFFFHFELTHYLFLHLLVNIIFYSSTFSLNTGLLLWDLSFGIPMTKYWEIPWNTPKNTLYSFRAHAYVLYRYTILLNRLYFKTQFLNYVRVKAIKNKNLMITLLLRQVHKFT